jgi:hypothetical protein
MDRLSLPLGTGGLAASSSREIPMRFLDFDFRLRREREPAA